MRRAALALLVACGGGHGSQPVQGGDYQVGTISFHVASGAAVSSTVLTLVLTDQPDTCDALRYVPVQRATKLTLKVSPAADGTTRATVVAKSTLPQAGEATGSLSQATGGIAGASYQATDGSVEWSVAPSGSVTIKLNLGFAGTMDRIVIGTALTIPPCTP